MENTEPVIDQTEDPDHSPADTDHGEDASEMEFGSDLNDLEHEESQHGDLAELIHTLQQQEGKCEYLAVGVSVVLEIRLLEKIQKMPSRIVGWQQNRFILIENPFRNKNLLNDLQKNRPEAIVRYLHNGTAIGFRTRVQHVAAVPQMLLNLQFPKEFESVVIRNNHRMEIAFPCSLILENRQIEGFMRDLSLDGTRVVTEESISPGTQVQLSFTLPNNKKIVKVNAEVKNQFPLKGGCALGLFFVETDENIKEVFHLLENMLRGSLPQ